jgi:general transcription factor 3C polypeptide 5 (transcription factor C subunit 1)
MSHYASSHNVLFKITVPKRTGRKRKRGSDEPWQGQIEQPVQDASPSAMLHSKAGLDDPKVLRRKLQDNPDRYEAEAVGVIKHTHRYRGMADFNYSMKNNAFMNDFTDKLLSGEGMDARSIVLRAVTDSHYSIQVPGILTEAWCGHHP